MTDAAPAPDEIKQVIVIRRDLGMRRGKEIAQGAHASMAWLNDAVVASLDNGQPVSVHADGETWLRHSWRKVTVYVRSEEDLVALHDEARQRGLVSHLVRDSGRTEFGGVPTLTALAIGPNRAADIDEVTGDLPLY